jgi:hypothetical protein
MQQHGCRDIKSSSCPCGMLVASCFSAPSVRVLAKLEFVSRLRLMLEPTAASTAVGLAFWFSLFLCCDTLCAFEADARLHSLVGSVGNARLKGDRHAVDNHQQERMAAALSKR